MGGGEREHEGEEGQQGGADARVRRKRDTEGPKQIKNRLYIMGKVGFGHLQIFFVYKGGGIRFRVPSESGSGK